MVETVLVHTLKRTLYLSLILFLPLVTFCTKQDVEIINDTVVDDLVVSLFASNSVNHQSAAVFQDYCVMVPDTRSPFYLYNLDQKKLVGGFELTPGKGKDFMGNTLFHCNQSTFGVDHYDENDFFPLLYISQRAGSDQRCFVEVYRIRPSFNMGNTDLFSFTAESVQTIFFPPMTSSNSLGNVNCVIDRVNRRMYTYSRNNNVVDSNYGICKISCFDIPDPKKETVYLSDNDIKESFMLNCSAVYMQGGCIENNFLYIPQGYASAGFIFFNVIDLNKKTLSSQFDLLGAGIQWEPEGCFFYDGNVMVTAGTNIWRFKIQDNVNS